MIFVAILLLIAGFVALVKGADVFVDGAAALAGKFGIPQLVIGLTIVAMGTSLPEAAVSITAGIKGNAGITVGNIVGSNILNILIILGVTALITNVAIQKTTFKYEIPYMGGVCVVIGSQLVVNGATTIARACGMSERFIGLTIVAFGTSLPELVTSVSAARKGNAGIAIGNIVGSNIFNILFVIGTVALICPVPFESRFVIDTVVAILCGVLLWGGTIRHKELRKPCGVVMLLCYAAYFVYLAAM